MANRLNICHPLKKTLKALLKWLNRFSKDLSIMTAKGKRSNLLMGLCQINWQSTFLKETENWSVYKSVSCQLKVILHILHNASQRGHISRSDCVVSHMDQCKFQWPLLCCDTPLTLDMASLSPFISFAAQSWWWGWCRFKKKSDINAYPL